MLGIGSAGARIRRAASPVNPYQDEQPSIRHPRRTWDRRGPGPVVAPYQGLGVPISTTIDQPYGGDPVRAIHRLGVGRGTTSPSIASYMDGRQGSPPSGVFSGSHRPTPPAAGSNNSNNIVFPPPPQPIIVDDPDRKALLAARASVPIPSKPKLPPSNLSNCSTKTAPARDLKRMVAVQKKLAKYISNYSGAGQRPNDDYTIRYDGQTTNVIDDGNDIPSGNKILGFASIDQRKIRGNPVYTIHEIQSDRIVLRSLGTPTKYVYVMQRDGTFNDIALSQFNINEVIAAGDNLVAEDVRAYYDVRRDEFVWRALALSFPRDTKTAYKRGSRWITHGTVVCLADNMLAIDTKLALDEFEIDDESNGKKKKMETFKIKAKDSAFEYPEPYKEYESTVVVRALLQGCEEHRWSQMATKSDTPWVAENITICGKKDEESCGVRSGKGTLIPPRRYYPEWTICAAGNFGYVHLPSEVREKVAPIAPYSTVYFEAAISLPDDKIPARLQRTTHRWRAVYVSANGKDGGTSDDENKPEPTPNITTTPLTPAATDTAITTDADIANIVSTTTTTATVPTTTAAESADRGSNAGSISGVSTSSSIRGKRVPSAAERPPHLVVAFADVEAASSPKARRLASPPPSPLDESKVVNLLPPPSSASSSTPKKVNPLVKAMQEMNRRMLPVHPSVEPTVVSPPHPPPPPPSPPSSVELTMVATQSSVVHGTPSLTMMTRHPPPVPTSVMRPSVEPSSVTRPPPPPPPSVDPTVVSTRPRPPPPPTPSSTAPIVVNLPAPRALLNDPSLASQLDNFVATAPRPPLVRPTVAPPPNVLEPSGGTSDQSDPTVPLRPSRGVPSVSSRQSDDGTRTPSRCCGIFPYCGGLHGK